MSWYLSNKSYFVAKIACFFALSYPLFAYENAKQAPRSSTIVTDDGGIFLEKKDGKNLQKIGIETNEAEIGAVYSYLKQRGYRFNVGARYEIAENEDDVILNLSCAALYACSKMGIYIGIEKGSEFEKFVISHGFKPKRGKLKISVALLKKIASLRQSADEESRYTASVSQKSIGAQYYLGSPKKNDILRGLKSSITYYDVDGRKLGDISSVLLKNNILYDLDDPYGQYLKGSKLSTELETSLKLSRNFKAQIGFGYEKMDYVRLDDRIRKTSKNMFGSTALSYRISKYKQLKIKAKKSNKTSSLIGAKYVENFGKSLKVFLSAEQNIDSNGFLDNRYGFGFSCAFGGEAKKEELAPLFETSNPPTNLRLNDLNPIGEVSQDSLETFD